MHNQRMKIGILGSGGVAQTLAAGFLTHGHDVTLGTRHPDKLSEWGTKNPAARIGSFADAAASARAIEPLCMLWCIPGFLRNEWSHAFKLLR
jgi:3-hydroxyisobutyrate dehydrogenase-like beta-hydroxyacid dehydrogenase